MVDKQTPMKTHLSALLLLATATTMAQSPYISRVFEYKPAPGQFVNVIPEYEDGDDADMMRLKAEEAIADNEGGMITLGGWGGYVIFGFDHMVKDIAGATDFIVYGNAFYSENNPNTETTRKGGSCEPAIVLVSYDSNGNGRPDDPWYELAGSEYHNPLCKTGYTVTYTRPDDDHQPHPSLTNKIFTDTTYILWQDSEGEEAYMYRNAYHKQPYFPEWIEEDELSFTGTRLPDNYIDESGTGSYYVQYAYDYGYADNHPNTSEQAQLDIAWAVDENGQAANLPGIHFVKVYTAVHQQCGWLGETSSEITGAEDLHFGTGLPSGTDSGKTSAAKKLFRNGQLLIRRNQQTYNMIGQLYH